MYVEICIFICISSICVYVLQKHFFFWTCERWPAPCSVRSTRRRCKVHTTPMKRTWCLPHIHFFKKKTMRWFHVCMYVYICTVCLCISQLNWSKLLVYVCMSSQDNEPLATASAMYSKCIVSPLIKQPTQMMTSTCGFIVQSKINRMTYSLYGYCLMD